MVFDKIYACIRIKVVLGCISALSFVEMGVFLREDWGRTPLLEVARQLLNKKKYNKEKET